MNTVKLKNGEEVVIRRMMPKDAAKLLSLMAVCGGETNYLIMDGRGPVINGMPITAEIEARYIEELCSLDNALMLGCFYGDKLIGMADIRGDQPERLRHCATLGIMIRKDFWGQGIGTTLIKMLIEFANNHPYIEIINLTVYSNNTRAIELYQRLGFERAGKFRRRVKIGEDYFDMLTMLLYL